MGRRPAKDDDRWGVWAERDMDTLELHRAAQLRLVDRPREAELSADGKWATVWVKVRGREIEKLILVNLGPKVVSVRRRR
jgi:hypothetical protein